MKRLLTLVMLICAMALHIHAQEDSVAIALKDAEQKAKLADKNPNDGKLQYKAGVAFIQDLLKDKKNYDLALQYLERAQKIAEAQTIMKDTLLGLTYMGLGTTYMEKKDFEKGVSYMGKASDAFEQELGKYDPLTNCSKLIYSMTMMGPRPFYAFYAFPKILEAFVNNNQAPENKRIENIDEANILLEIATEMFIAAQTKMFRYALPLISFKGKRCLVIQTADWNIERPLVGWMVPSMLDDDEENDTINRDPNLLFDDNGQIIAMTEEERKQKNLVFNFRYFARNPRRLVSNEGDSRIWFMSPEDYGKVLAAYREYKKKEK